MQKLDLGVIDPAVEPDGEKIHRVVRGTVGSIPVVGSVALEIFNSVFESPMSKRRTEFMIQIGELVNELIDRRGLTESDLQENQAFVSTVAQACHIAMRNHQEEKLEQLRNAVRNSALECCPSEDYRLMFLHLVDACTVTHLKLLRLFNDPDAWFSNRGITQPQWVHASIADVVAVAMPDAQLDSAVLEVIWDDLHAKKLVATQYMGVIVHAGESIQTSAFGSDFIAFLS